jgi:hypothetical protein
VSSIHSSDSLSLPVTLAYRRSTSAVSGVHPEHGSYWKFANGIFLIYDTNQNPEAITPPSPELMAEMGKFIGEATQAGVVVTTGALQPTSTRLRLSGGTFSVTDGPYIEAKELLGGFAVIQVNSLEEAIAWSKRFRQIVGDGESEIVRLFGPDDFGPA